MVTPILQARMRSERLPGKVLKSLCGETVLAHIVKRISRAKLAPIVVATGETAADNPIADECARLGVVCIRGSEHDVLARFYMAAQLCNAGDIMRICADNPLIEYTILDALVDFYSASDYSYVRVAGAPVGLGAEIFTYDRLKDAYINGLKSYHREHVTPYMYENDVDCARLELKPDRSALRFTLDTPEDFAFITEVYTHLYKKNPNFGINDVLNLINERPELTALNSSVKQRSIG